MDIVKYSNDNCVRGDDIRFKEMAADERSVSLQGCWLLVISPKIIILILAAYISMNKFMIFLLRPFPLSLEFIKEIEQSAIWDRMEQKQRLCKRMRFPE